MAYTAKQICDAVLDEMALPRQDQYFGSSTANDRTLPALLNTSLEELALQDYTDLKTSGSITLTTATSYDLPSDFNYIVPDTLNVQDQVRRPYLTTPENWFFLEASNINSGLRYRVRIVGDQLQVNSPQSGDEITFEYHTTNLVKSSGSATFDKERFTNDDDTPILRDRLLVKDLKWRYGEAMGQEGWQTYLAQFRAYENKIRGQDGGSESITIGMNYYEPIVEPYIDPWQ